MREALFIDIDVDQYEGAIQALSWIFKNGLYIEGVTIISYDDWCGIDFKKGFFPDPACYHSRLDVAEIRAHKQAAEKFNVEFVQISGQAPAFLVKSVGQVASHGIHYPCVCNSSPCPYTY